MSEAIENKAQEIQDQVSDRVENIQQQTENKVEEVSKSAEAKKEEVSKDLEAEETAAKEQAEVKKEDATKTAQETANKVNGVTAVSYTHLDVYKRQMWHRPGTCNGCYHLNRRRMRPKRWKRKEQHDSTDSCIGLRKSQYYGHRHLYPWSQKS